MEELECVKDMIPEFQKMLMRAPYDVDKTLPYYRSLAKDIVKHKNRLGGNFVIAQAVSKRNQRDCMKEIFGSQGIFVLLQLSKETNAKRIEGRHEGLCKDPEKLKYLIETMNGFIVFHFKIKIGSSSFLFNVFWSLFVRSISP